MPGAYRSTQVVQHFRVPATVQAVLAARIDLLAPEDKGLLQMAAVIGPEVPFALLQALAEQSDAELRAGLASENDVRVRLSLQVACVFASTICLLTQ